MEELQYVVGGLVAAVLSALAPAVHAQGGASGGDQSDEAKQEEARERAKRAKEEFEKGAAYYEKQKYAEAIVHFRRGQRLYPSALFLYNIAMCHMQMGQSSRAREYARRALASERRPLDGETATKARSVEAGSLVVTSAEGIAGAAGEGARTKGVEPKGSPETETIRGFGVLGWTGLSAAVLGTGALVASGVLASDINSDWERLQSLRRSANRSKFENLQSEIAREQKLGRGLGIGGAALTLAGAGLVVADFVTGPKRRRVYVRPNGLSGVSVFLRW